MSRISNSNRSQNLYNASPVAAEKVKTSEPEMAQVTKNSGPGLVLQENYRTLEGTESRGNAAGKSPLLHFSAEEQKVLQSHGESAEISAFQGLLGSVGKALGQAADRGLNAAEARLDKAMNKPSETGITSTIDADGLNNRFTSSTTAQIQASAEQVAGELQGNWENWWGSSEVKTEATAKFEGGQSFDIKPLGDLKLGTVLPESIKDSRLGKKLEGLDLPEPVVHIDLQPPTTTIGEDGTRTIQFQGEVSGDFTGPATWTITQRPGESSSTLEARFHNVEVTGAVGKLPGLGAALAGQLHTQAERGVTPGFPPTTGLAGLQAKYSET